jgi:hypothetical protein
MWIQPCPDRGKAHGSLPQQPSWRKLRSSGAYELNCSLLEYLHGQRIADLARRTKMYLSLETEFPRTGDGSLVATLLSLLFGG